MIRYRPNWECWERVVNYYYEHVHWDRSQFGLTEWLRLEWNVQHRGIQNELWFYDEKYLTYFLLRWS